MGKLMAREKQFMAAMLFDKSFRFAVSSDADLPLSSKVYNLVSGWRQPSKLIIGLTYILKELNTAAPFKCQGLSEDLLNK
jgi:hypothetical protein